MKLRNARQTGLLALGCVLACAGICQAEAPLPSARFHPPEVVVGPEFSVELVASAPLVRHPMMAGFDDRGRLYVAESLGENLRAPALLENPPNMIVRLEDIDGDGVFDKRTMFADKMTFPMGALWHDGWLYVASPPSIWRLKDTDDDGVADIREEIVNKFNFTGNAASIHGCFLGPNGRIYWCDGRHGHDVSLSEQTAGTAGHAARVFSCEPDGSNVEVVCGGGMDNPVEVAFLPTGEMLGTMTFYNPDKDRHDAMVHFVHGGVYPKHHPCLEEFARTGELLPALSLFGVVAPAGMTVYRGNHLGADFRGDAFSVHFNTHQVVRHHLTRSGGTFAARDEVFLSSMSPDFHPTDVLEDADGSLLVIDTGGWFRIGCPTSQVAKPEVLGAIYRVRRRDGRPMPDPRGRRIARETSTVPELANLLNDARPAVRDQAQRRLIAADAEAVPALSQLLNTTEIDLRRRAVWALSQINQPAARVALVHALAADAADVRIAAARSLGTVRADAATAALVTTLQDAEPAVRREAATALGRIGNPAVARRAKRPPVHESVVPALLAALALRNDRFVEHAILYALIEINAAKSTAAGLAASAPQVRRGALIALDQMRDNPLTREMVAPQLDTDDTALQSVALEIISRHPGWSEEILGLLTNWLQADEPLEGRGALLRGAVLAYRHEAAIQQVVADALARQSLPDGTRLLLLETIARSELEQLPTPWKAAVTTGLNDRREPVLRQTLLVVRGLTTGEFDQKLQQLSSDDELTADVRTAALAALGSRLGPLNAAQFDLLFGQLAEETAPLARLAAAETLSQAELSLSQQLALVTAIGRAGPLECGALLGCFEAAHESTVGQALVAALLKSPGALSLSESHLRRALQKFPEEITTQAQPLFAKLNRGLEEQKALLAKLAPALAGGDVQQGRQVFEHRKAACMACHRVRGTGGVIGPDLSTIGKIRTERDLLEAIVLPSASLARGYETFTVSTTTGRQFSGVVQRETAAAIYLRTADRSEIRIARDQIDELLPTPVSIMPQGFERVLSQDELRDLIAYLRSVQ